MAAPPERIWGLVSDITNTSHLSEETFEAKWLDGATAPGNGVRFRGHVRRNGRGPAYWTTCTIVACEPGKEFAFGVGAGSRTVITWRYQLSPSGDGTDVTESFELADTAPTRLYWKLAGAARGRTNERNMRMTLERIRAAAEAAAPA